MHQAANPPRTKKTILFSFGSSRLRSKQQGFCFFFGGGGGGDKSCTTQVIRMLFSCLGIYQLELSTQLDTTTNFPSKPLNSAPGFIIRPPYQVPTIKKITKVGNLISVFSTHGKRLKIKEKLGGWAVCADGDWQFSFFLLKSHRISSNN